MTPPATDRAAMAMLLGRLAEETGELAARADGLQGLFGRLLALDAKRGACPGVEEAQALDELVQRLHGLAGFLTAMSQGSLEDVDAAARSAAAHLTLTRQIGRLAGAAGLAPACRAPSGEVDLF